MDNAAGHIYSLVHKESSEQTLRHIVGTKLVILKCVHHM